MFNNVKVTGNGSNQTAITLDPLLEGTVKNFILENSTGSEQAIVVTVDSVSFSVKVAATDPETSTSVLIPTGGTVSINAPTGVNVVLQYIEMASDVSAALTAAQQFISTLPAGSVNDSSVSTTSTFSSNKLNSEFAKLAEINMNGRLSENSINVTSSANSTVLDCSLANGFRLVKSENTTISFTNLPISGQIFSMAIEIVNDANDSGYVVTWPVSVVWPNGTAPDPSTGANVEDTYILYTNNGGATFKAVLAGRNFS